MPTTTYKYTCGHSVSVLGRPCPCFYNQLLRIEQPAEFYANQQFYMEQSHARHSTERHPDSTAASALESLDRESHARIAGLPSMRSHNFGPATTQIHTPYYASYERKDRIFSPFDDYECYHDQKLYKDYKCRSCRKPKKSVAQKLVAALKPPRERGMKSGGIGVRYMGQ